MRMEVHHPMVITKRLIMGSFERMGVASPACWMCPSWNYATFIFSHKGENALQLKTNSNDKDALPFRGLSGECSLSIADRHAVFHISPLSH